MVHRKAAQQQFSGGAFDFSVFKYSKFSKKQHMQHADCKMLFVLFDHLIHHEFSLILIFASAICRILSGEYVGVCTLALLI